MDHLIAFDVCPWWMGYLIDNPVRSWLQKPKKFLEPHISPGAVCLDIGCGMGFFARPMAQCAGPGGVVHAVDLQEKMLAALMRRARRLGIEEVVKPRQCTTESLNLGDLAGRIDFALAGYMVHEVPDQAALFAQVAATLAPGGAFMVLEPKAHVSESAFGKTLEAARAAGLALEDRPAFGGSMTALLRRLNS